MDAWNVLGLAVYPYGTVLAAASLIALLWAAWQMQHAGLKDGCGSWVALFCVPLAVLFSRLLFCLMILDEIAGLSQPEMIIQFSSGGYLLWGAVGGALLAGWLTSRLRKESVGDILDCLILPACFLIVVGRIAGGLIAEQDIGLDLASWFSPEETEWSARYSLFPFAGYEALARFPFAVTNYYGEYCWAVFMLEAVWTVICGWVSQRTQARSGGRTVRFLLWFACGQVLMEAMLRGEVVHLPYLGFVRANQIVCAVVILIIWKLCLSGVPKAERRKAGIVSFLQILLGILIVVLMEFAAFEKKITLIDWMPADVCHLVMALGCLLMGLAIRPLWRKRFQSGILQ